MATAGLTFRLATADDVPAIVGLYADDVLGATRETATDPLPASYLAAFAAVEEDPTSTLVVAELDGEVVGTLQLTVTPLLLHGGGSRCTIEAVRVASPRRGGGLGSDLLTWAIDQARDRGCVLVQLTTDARRPEARRFYERLGFQPSHVGMKLPLR